jgi:transposase InsO family protein
MGLTVAEKRKIRAEFAKRYRKAKKAEKANILNQHLKLIGKGSRKYEAFALNREGKKQSRLAGSKFANVEISGSRRKKRMYKKYCDDEAAKALITLWKFFRYICAERLIPLLRADLDPISRKKRFGISREVKKKPAVISRAAVERLLTAERQKYKLKGKSAARKGSLLKNQTPVRVFWARDEKKPCFCEIDTVSHDGGGEISPNYAWTLAVTDAALCRAEVRALKNKAQKRTMEAAAGIFKAFPVPLRGIDSGSGSEFINFHFMKRCEEHRITFTRGRPRHSNDNCFVEQKNGGIVRKTAGYSRFEGGETLAALKKVYSFLNPLVNYFYPAKKCIGKKTLANGKVKRVCETKLKTPFERVLEHSLVSEEHKTKAKKIKEKPGIATLQENLEKACDELGFIVSKKFAVPSSGQFHG